MSPVHAGQMLQLVDGKEFRHNKVSDTIPTNFQSRQFTIEHFTVHGPFTIGSVGQVSYGDHDLFNRACRLPTTVSLLRASEVRGVVGPRQN
jgi:hypothetical protein